MTSADQFLARLIEPPVFSYYVNGRGFRLGYQEVVAAILCGLLGGWLGALTGFVAVRLAFTLLERVRRGIVLQAQGESQPASPGYIALGIGLAIASGAAAFLGGWRWGWATSFAASCATWPAFRFVHWRAVTKTERELARFSRRFDRPTVSEKQFQNLVFRAERDVSLLSLIAEYSLSPRVLRMLFDEIVNSGIDLRPLRVYLPAWVLLHAPSLEIYLSGRSQVELQRIVHGIRTGNFEIKRTLCRYTRPLTRQALDDLPDELPHGLLYDRGFHNEHARIKELLELDHVDQAGHAAIEATKRALEDFGVPHPVSRCLLASAYLRAGHHKEAEETYRGAAELAEIALTSGGGANWESEVDPAWISLVWAFALSKARHAKLVAQSGDPLRSATTARDAIAFCRREIPSGGWPGKHGDETDRAMLELLEVFASALVFLNHATPLAESLSRGVWRWHVNRFGTESDEALTTEILLARAYLLNDRIDRARDHYGHARRLVERDDNALVEWTAFLIDSASEEAEAEIRSQLVRTEDRHPLARFQLNAQLAHLLVARGRLREARSCLEISFRESSALQMHHATFASDVQRQTMAPLFSLPLHMLTSLMVANGPEFQQEVGILLRMILQRKSLTMEILRWVRRHASADPELSRWHERLVDLKGAIGAVELGASPNLRHDQGYARLLAEREELGAHLATQVPPFPLPDLTVADLAAALPPRSVLVEYFVSLAYDFNGPFGVLAASSARTLAIVLPAGAPDHCSLVDLGDSAIIEEAVARHHDEREPGGNESKDEAWSVRARTVRELLFDPVLARAGPNDHLFIAPDGEVNRVSFAALPLDGDHLVNRYTFSYVTTGRDLVEPVVKPSAAPGMPVVIADPDYDWIAPLENREQVMRNVYSGLPDEVVEVLTRDRKSDEQGTKKTRPERRPFERREFTRAEGEDVARLLGVEPWMDKRATEARLKSVSSPAVLHIATHGYFIDAAASEAVASGRLTGSGFALAGANAHLANKKLHIGANEGLVGAEDVLSLRLAGTELVVLSACDTGLGNVRIGEGVAGLRRSFIAAGAHTLVMSLWKVPEALTARLMLLFYRNLLRGTGRAEALRRAQRTFARTHHPRYWGAFICQGRTGPLPDALCASVRERTGEVHDHRR